MSSDSDSSGPNDKAPPKKKTKEEKPAKKSEKPEKKSEKPEKKSKKRAKSDDEDDEEGEDGRWEIAPKRFVSVSEFKGRKRVDIREFYTTPDGEEKPGRKGISMPEDQWKKLKAIIPKIDKHMNDI